MTVALITGASRGLGATASRRLASQGVTVLAGARKPAALAKVLRAEAPELDIRPIALDVNDDASVDAAVHEVKNSVGAIDVLVNNAGVDGTYAPAPEVGPDDVRRVFETNVLGPVRVTQAFLPLLTQGQHPRLVMVSSGLGSLELIRTNEFYRNIAVLPYPASKAALNMLTVQYAKALPNVIVTAVDPGYTATEFNGYSGPQTIEEGTDAVVAAVLDTTGPSGRFLDRNGAVPW